MYNYGMIELTLPKFELKFNSRLNDILSKLGMNYAFNENFSDFNELIEKKY